MRLRTLFSLSRSIWQKAVWENSYSPIFVPPVFFLLLRIKTVKDHYFGNLKAVKEATTKCLKEAPVKAFRGTFNTWKKRWRGYFYMEEIYFTKFYLIVHLSIHLFS